MRGGAAGDAARLAAPLRNQRVQMQVRADTGHAARLEMERAERSRKRIEQGGPTRGRGTGVEISGFERPPSGHRFT